MHSIPPSSTILHGLTWCEEGSNHQQLLNTLSNLIRHSKYFFNWNFLTLAAVESNKENRVAYEWPLNPKSKENAMKEDTERVPLTENRVPEHEQKFNYANKCPVCEQKIESERECLEHLTENHTECKFYRGSIDPGSTDFFWCNRRTFFSCDGNVLNLVEFYSNATNGFLFSNQCRKCGLCGVKNGQRIGHFGPRARNLCERVKAKLVQLQVHPIKPWKKESVQSLILI